MLDSIIIKESSIHGLGMFATRDIKPGETVVTWSAKKFLSKEEALQLSANELFFVSQYDHETYILLDEPARYVNHSCQPNTQAVDGADVATRLIVKGEEITADYATEGILFQFHCSCHSVNCRRVIGTKR